MLKEGRISVPEATVCLADTQGAEGLSSHVW